MVVWISQVIIAVLLLLFCVFMTVSVIFFVVSSISNCQLLRACKQIASIRTSATSTPQTCWFEATPPLTAGEKNPKLDGFASMLTPGCQGASIFGEPSRWLSGGCYGTKDPPLSPPSKMEPPEVAAPKMLPLKGVKFYQKLAISCFPFKKKRSGNVPFPKKTHKKKAGNASTFCSHCKWQNSPTSILV